MDPAQMLQDVREYRRGGILDLVRLLRTLNLDGLDDLLSAIGRYRDIQLPITDREGLKQRVIAGLEILKAAAYVTPGETDNELVATIERIILDGDLLNLILDLIDRFVGPPVIGMEAVAQEVPANEVEPKGISVPAIVAIVQAIIGLINVLRD